MEDMWSRFWKRTLITSMLGLPLVWLIESPAASWLFIGGAAYSLSSLQTSGREEVDWIPILKGFSVYFILIIAVAAISFYR
jgi:hypothetical protein